MAGAETPTGEQAVEQVLQTQRTDGLIDPAELVQLTDMMDKGIKYENASTNIVDGPEFVQILATKVKVEDIGMDNIKDLIALNTSFAGWQNFATVCDTKPEMKGFAAIIRKERTIEKFNNKYNKMKKESTTAEAKKSAETTLATETKLISTGIIKSFPSMSPAEQKVLTELFMNAKNAKNQKLDKLIKNSGLSTASQTMVLAFVNDPKFTMINLTALLNPPVKTPEAPAMTISPDLLSQIPQLSVLCDKMTGLVYTPPDMDTFRTLYDGLKPFLKKTDAELTALGASDPVMGKMVNTLITNRAILVKTHGIYESIYTQDPLGNIYTNLNTLTPKNLTKEHKLQLHTIINQDREQFEKWKTDFDKPETQENATKVAKLYLSLEMPDVDMTSITLVSTPIKESITNAQGISTETTTNKITIKQNGKFIQEDGKLVDDVVVGTKYKTLGFGFSGKAMLLADATKAFPGMQDIKQIEAKMKLLQDGNIDEPKQFKDALTALGPLGAQATEALRDPRKKLDIFDELKSAFLTLSMLMMDPSKAGYADAIKKMEIEQAQISFKKNFASDIKDIVPPIDPIESAKVTSIVSNGRIWKILDVRGQSIADKGLFLGLPIQSQVDFIKKASLATDTKQITAVLKDYLGEIGSKQPAQVATVETKSETPGVPFILGQKYPILGSDQEVKKMEGEHPYLVIGNSIVPLDAEGKGKITQYIYDTSTPKKITGYTEQSITFKDGKLVIGEKKETPTPDNNQLALLNQTKLDLTKTGSKEVFMSQLVNVQSKILLDDVKNAQHKDLIQAYIYDLHTALNGLTNTDAEQKVVQAKITALNTNQKYKDIKTIVDPMTPTFTPQPVPKA